MAGPTKRKVDQRSEEFESHISGHLRKFLERLPGGVVKAQSSIAAHAA
jgi:hypothetical protein